MNKLSEMLRLMFRDNPMHVEIRRYRRRFFSFTGSSSANSVLLALLCLIYAGIVLLVVTYRGDINPVVLVSFQTLVFAFLAPSILHGAVAGERERRSWDLLLVAPVTEAQIVAGKLIGAVAALALASAAFAIPVLIAALTYRTTHLAPVIVSELLSLSFTALLCAVTLFFSARVKRAFVSLGVVLGFEAIVLVIGPALLSAIAGSDQFSMNLALYLHPALTLSRLQTACEASGFRPEDSLPDYLFGLPQAGIYLLLTLVLMVWTAKTIRFADNEVKFLPKKKLVGDTHA